MRKKLVASVRLKSAFVRLVRGDSDLREIQFGDVLDTAK
jgi:hypothetical protein